MSYERADVDDLIKAKYRARQSAILPMARLITGAAPVMDNLTRSAEWERYVTYLQGMIDRYKAQRELALKKLADPSITEDREVRKLRQGIFIADVTIDTMTFAIGLPAMILKGGEEASKFVTDFEAKNEAAGESKP
jgi:hypothetical protein